MPYQTTIWWVESDLAAEYVNGDYAPDIERMLSEHITELVGMEAEYTVTIANEPPEFKRCEATGMWADCVPLKLTVI